MPTLDLGRIKYFVSVVKTGSFSAAAINLNVNKSVVSHHISKLEQELGAAILIRTTRKLRVTEFGKQLYERCITILDQADAVIAEVGDQQEKPTGRLTLTAPEDFGTHIVTGAIAAYIKKFPQVNVNLVFDDQKLDFVQTDIDLAIRVGWLTDSSAKMRRIGTFKQILVAAPECHSTQNIRKPTDITDAPWIENAVLKSALKWRFTKGKSTTTVKVNAVTTTNKTLSTYACTIAGIGISALPDYLVREDILAGRLIHVLPEWTLPQGGIYFLFPPGQHRPAKVSAFVETLAAYINENPINLI